MIQLYAFPWEKTIIWVLSISLILLVLFIIARKVKARVLRGTPDLTKYCVLYPLENELVSGEIEIYFTCEELKYVSIVVLDSGLEEVFKIVEKEFSSGGNIVRFDTSIISNGHYFYCLQTDNQKTMKKMVVNNA